MDMLLCVSGFKEHVKKWFRLKVKTSAEMPVGTVYQHQVV